MASASTGYKSASRSTSLGSCCSGSCGCCSPSSPSSSRGGSFSGRSGCSTRS